MDSSLIVALAVAALYLFSGGRWTFVLLAAVAYFWQSQKSAANTRKASKSCKCGGGGCCTTKSKHASPDASLENEIDFTYSFK
ncbi:hypothetical protein KL918_000543 [Ogataea parapolymorpha]|nr:hypothetical protein KL918_000543 [Ogataea parapolymorpha]KAG7875288.1 hypothetical protein KL916_000900 [Ogataea parapolymorpha]KAG7885236.1 hypothetical protein KL938_001493 [Ogataea parapolymorpha]